MASTYICNYVHIVFATRDRAPMIANDWRRDLHNYIGGTCTGLDSKPMIIGGVADHVHLLVSLKATHRVADFVREVKKASSVWAATHFAKFGWQTGYAAFSVGAAEVPRVTAYIANQEEHHRRQSSAEELRLLLAEHGVEFDVRFFEMNLAPRLGCGFFFGPLSRGLRPPGYSAFTPAGVKNPKPEGYCKNAKGQTPGMAITVKCTTKHHKVVPAE